MSSSKIGFLTTSENRDSVGKYITAKFVVIGGLMYLSDMRFASVRIAASNDAVARLTSSASAISRAFSSRDHGSFGNFASIGRATAVRKSSSVP